ERGPLDSNRRRAAAQRLSPVGVRLRGARVLRDVLARLHGSGVQGSARRVQPPRPPLRPALRSALPALGLTAFPPPSSVGAETALPDAASYSLRDSLGKGGRLWSFGAARSRTRLSSSSRRPSRRPSRRRPRGSRLVS